MQSVNSQKSDYSQNPTGMPETRVVIGIHKAGRQVRNLDKSGEFLLVKG